MIMFSQRYYSQLNKANTYEEKRQWVPYVFLLHHKLRSFQEVDESLLRESLWLDFGAGAGCGGASEPCSSSPRDEPLNESLWLDFAFFVRLGSVSSCGLSALSVLEVLLLNHGHGP